MTGSRCYAESVTVPVSALARIPDELSFAEAAPMGFAGVTWSSRRSREAAEHRRRRRVRSGFADIGQGTFALWFKFIAENVPFMVLPGFVLYAIYLQIDYLTSRTQ